MLLKYCTSQNARTSWQEGTNPHVGTCYQEGSSHHGDRLLVRPQAELRARIRSDPYVFVGYRSWMQLIS